MAPATSNAVPNGKYLVVTWDLDTTGRRLIDEICQIGGYYVNNVKKDSVFSQYVMPYKNPNPGARRSFGIKVVSVGRYRMLKDMDSGKILETKSEVSALQDFIDWLEEARNESKSDGILLACHEPNRKVLVPLLLEALTKYSLQDSFNKTVKGFVNGVSVVESLGCKQTITSNSLRSLCKTVLRDTNPNTNSASDRCKVLIEIISRVCSPESEPVVDNVEGGDKPAATVSTLPIDASKLLHVATSVKDEHAELKHLKSMLDTQGTLRPIFEQQLKQRRAVRERAMNLRRLVAESGMDYKAVEEIFKSFKDAQPPEEPSNGQAENSEEHKDTEEESKVDSEIKEKLKGQISDATDEDLDELIILCKNHFSNIHAEVANVSGNYNSTGVPKPAPKPYHNRPYNPNYKRKPVRKHQKKSSPPEAVNNGDPEPNPTEPTTDVATEHASPKTS